MLFCKQILCSRVPNSEMLTPLNVVCSAQLVVYINFLGKQTQHLAFPHLVFRHPILSLFPVFLVKTACSFRFQMSNLHDWDPIKFIRQLIFLDCLDDFLRGYVLFALLCFRPYNSGYACLFCLFVCFFPSQDSQCLLCFVAQKLPPPLHFLCWVCTQSPSMSHIG